MPTPSKKAAQLCSVSSEPQETKAELKYKLNKQRQEAYKNRPYRERADWQFRRSEYKSLASELGNSDGEFDVDLFTDGKGMELGNSQCKMLG